jgi:hypothetical protein
MNKTRVKNLEKKLPEKKPRILFEVDGKYYVDKWTEVDRGKLDTSETLVIFNGIYPPD